MKDRTINADQARIKYFNLYVELEHSIRKLARKTKMGHKTRYKSLKQVVNELGIFNYQKKLGIQMKIIKAQVKVRNWLAHRPKFEKVPDKYLEYMKQVKNLINHLKNI